MMMVLIAGVHMVLMLMMVYEHVMMDCMVMEYMGPAMDYMVMERMVTEHMVMEYMPRVMLMDNMVRKHSAS